MADTPPPRGPEYVGFWKRFLAFLIDSLVVGVVLSPVMLAGTVVIRAADGLRRG
jgi:uncharacterized RDD family membrane protein YckC